MTAIGPSRERTAPHRHALAASRLGMTLDDYNDHLKAGEKWCTGCKAWHPRAQFGKDSSRTDGLQTACRAARKQQPPPTVSCGACGRTATARNSRWCNACGLRWEQAGRPDAGPPPPRPLEEVNADRRAALARGIQTQLQGFVGRLEDFAFLRSTGETDQEMVARRLGVKPSTVERYQTLLRRPSTLRIRTGDPR